MAEFKCRARNIKIEAYRVGGGGNIEFVLPDGTKVEMTRTECDEWVARLQTASKWLIGTIDRRAF